MQILMWVVKYGIPLVGALVGIYQFVKRTRTLYDVFIHRIEKSGFSFWYRKGRGFQFAC